MPAQGAIIDLVTAFFAAHDDLEATDGAVVGYRTVIAVEAAYAELGTAIAEWKRGLVSASR